MKNFLTIATFLIMGHICLAQTGSDALKANIQRSADSMATAFKARDWKTIIHFSPQSVIDMAGGEESLLQMTESIMSQIPADAIKQFSIGPVVQVVKTPADWQCVVEQHMTMELQGNRITMMSPLIGQSLNNGASWTFFDSKGDTATAKTFLTTLSSELVLPKSIQNVEKLDLPPTAKKAPTATKPAATKPAAKKPVATKPTTTKKN